MITSQTVTTMEGLTAIVTGAGSGIGLATARQLSSEGVRVFGFDIEEGEMAGVAEWVSCDVGDTASVEHALTVVTTSVERLDILINNAGIGAIGSVEFATDDEWTRVLNVNVVGLSRVTAAALPLLRHSSVAAVVNTCSVAAAVGLPDRDVYTASKGAVQALTMAMAADYLREGIRVNCVNPGTADTPWVTRLLDQAEDPVAERSALERRQPSGRLVSAEEVASAICFLAHPRQAAMTGTVLAVDGGMHSLRIRAE